MNQFDVAVVSPNAHSSETTRAPDSTGAIDRRCALVAAASTASIGALAGCVGTLREIASGGGGDVDLERLEVLNDDQTAHDVTLELQQGEGVGFHREFALDAKRDDGKTVVDSEPFREGWTLDRGTYRVAIRLGDDAWTKQSYDPTVTEVIAVVIESGNVVIPDGT